MNGVPFNLKLNWLFNGIGLIHFGVFFFEIFDLKVGLIKYSENINWNSMIKFTASFSSDL